MIAVTLFSVAWASLYWMMPLETTALYGPVYRTMNSLVAGWFGVTGDWVVVIKAYLMVGIFIAIQWLRGYRLKALGLSRPAARGWRITALCYAVALPFLVAVGHAPSMIHYYRDWLSSEQGMVHIAASLAVLVPEHAYVEGAVLATMLPGNGFQDDDSDVRRAGRLALFGFGQPPGGKGLLSWLGTPAHVLPALIGNGIVFSAIHVGKSPVEILSAFPGGVGLALLTWRIRSVWPCLLLHLSAAATILLTAVVLGR